MGRRANTAGLRRWWSLPPSLRWTVGVTLAALLYKLPVVLLHGRLFAEEGTYFLRDLDGRSLATATTYVFRGSLLLLTNWSVWLAALAPVRLIPLVSTWLSVALLLLIAAQIAGWCRGQGVGRGVAMLVPLAMVLTPLTDEVLANTTNLQWLCSLSVLLFLISPADRLREGEMAKLPWLILCGLTGVPSCFLMPFFWLRGVVERSRPHLIMAVILTATTALQLTLVLSNDVGDRHFQLRPLLVATAAAIHTLVLPLVGKQAGWVAHGFVVPADALIAWRAVLLLIPCFIAVGLAGLWALRAGATRMTVFLLVVAGSAATAINCFGVLGPPEWLLGPTANTRYFVLLFVCVLLLLTLASRGVAPEAKLAGLAIGWIALMGAAIYCPGRRSDVDSGPSWQAQVDRCQAQRQQTCTVAIWPTYAGRPPEWVVRVEP